jgi:glutamate-1-semialdehyde aminotransferase
MALVVKPSAVIKALWFSFGTGAAYAAYMKLNKDLWSGAKQVGAGFPAFAFVGTAPPAAAACHCYGA